MKTATFYSYLPKRYTTDDVQTERIRRFIYSFKRGDRHAVDFAINIVSECLNKWYGASNQDYVLVCVPAATSAKYNRRFKRFAEEVSKRTGIQNGTAHVNIFGMREAQQRRAHRQRVVWLLREHRPRLLRRQERDTLRRPHYYRSHGGGVRRRTRSGRR